MNILSQSEKALFYTLKVILYQRGVSDKKRLFQVYYRGFGVGTTFIGNNLELLIINLFITDGRYDRFDGPTVVPQFVLP